MTDVKRNLSGAVLEVVFDRPERKNALTFAAYDAVVEACEVADADPGVRVMVLRGSGDSFAAGTDIGELASFIADHGGTAYEERIESVLSRLEGVRVPVVAAVQGVAAGAGLLIVACADICVASVGSRFGAPVARTLGNPISLRNLDRLKAAVGIRRAKALLMTAGFVDADEAHRAGLVADVVPAGAFAEHVDALVHRIAGFAPLALRSFKEGFRRLAAGADADADRDLIELCYSSNDFREGVQSFLGHRPAHFEGR